MRTSFRYKMKYQERIAKVGKQRYLTLSATLYRHDLENLVSCGVPSDEYNHEALLVLEESDKEPDLTEAKVQRILVEVFAKMFSPPRDDYRQKRIERGMVSEKYAAAAKEVFGELRR